MMIKENISNTKRIARKGQAKSHVNKIMVKEEKQCQFTNTDAWNVGKSQKYFFAILVAKVLNAQFAAVRI